MTNEDSDNREIAALPCGCAWFGGERISWCGEPWHWPTQLVLTFTSSGYQALDKSVRQWDDPGKGRSTA